MILSSSFLAEKSERIMFCLLLLPPPCYRMLPKGRNLASLTDIRSRPAILPNAPTRSPETECFSDFLPVRVEVFLGSTGCLRLPVRVEVFLDSTVCLWLPVRAEVFLDSTGCLRFPVAVLGQDVPRYTGCLLLSIRVEVSLGSTGCL